jgi:7-cyano-7-deazaguanine reductase
MSKNPLGAATRYPSTYSPDLLFAVARIDARNLSNIGEELPFAGVDLWNAWELTWLDLSGKPVVATAEIRVPAVSPAIIESKSLKLYLNSLSMSRYENAISVRDVIQDDLSKTAGATVLVKISLANHWQDQQVSQMPGTCIDASPASASAKDVDASLLKSNLPTVEKEELHSHLLYSNCPVTNQPDSGSILIRYSGPKIDETSLLNYLVSYRQHNDFHEACVERIFVDIKKRCGAEKLTVYARYNRRGGLDINPFRTDFEEGVENIRLWRQ